MTRYNIFTRIIYTFESACGTRSCIDHIVVTENIVDAVKSYKCLNDVDNNSDHLPIVSEFGFECTYSSVKVNKCFNQCKWFKATDHDIAKYKVCLDANLDLFVNNRVGVFDCLDPHCNNDEHVYCLEELYVAVVNACLESSKQTIPQSGNKTKGVKCPMPGFSEHVKQYRDTALGWHRLWKQYGRPRQGHIAEMRKLSRSRYHYKVKAVKQQQCAIRSERMAEALQKGDQNSLWKCIKSQKSKCVPCSIDGCNNPADISQLFARKYETLYNSVGYEADDLKLIQERIESKINSNSLENAMFTYEHIKKAVRMLKHNKHDGNTGLYSNNVIHGTDKLFRILVKLFNSLLTHGYTLNDMLLGTLTPIVKDRRAKLSSSENFRSICLQNVLCKLMDLMILFKESESLVTSDMQFGFKPESSTSLATSMFLETTDYYVRNGGNVFALALDASKAFDRVNFVKIFKLLEQRNVNPVYIRFLVDNYVKQKLRVMYNEEVSNYFNVSNGVKQGAVLSPTLFSVYVDNLLCKINEKHLGCHIGNTCCGIIGYADDILLLAPTVKSLESMIKVCENYACEYEIKFNGNKSQLMIFGDYKQDINIYVNNEKLKTVSEMKYLGHIISNSIHDPLISNVKNDFVCKANSFLANFSSVSSHVRNHLFKQYCISLYGSNSCMLDHNDVNSINIAWRKSIRRVWNLPYKTHGALLPHVAESLPINYIMYKRFCKHFISGINHKNKSVCSVFRSSLYHSSRLSNNFRLIAKICKVGIPTMARMPVGTGLRMIDEVFELSSQESDVRVAAQIKELCIKRDSCSINEWVIDKNDINAILSVLCTD